MLWLAIHFPLLPLEVFNNDIPPASGKQKKEEKPLACSDKKPLATLNEEPLACSNKEPLAVLNKEPSASFYKKPLAIYKKPLATYEEPLATRHKKPLAIYEERRGRNLISYCNQSAIEQGIEAGMSDSSGIALCHDIQLIPRDIDKEKQLLQQLAETAYQFSSQVIIYTTRHSTFYHSNTTTFKNIQNQQHSLLLEVSRSLKLFDGLDRLSHLISDRFTRHPLSASGFHHQITTANSPLLSEVFARSLYVKKQDSPIKAAITQHPVLEGQASYIPITLLDCDNNSKQQCEAMGLHTLNALFKLPRDTLGRRFNRGFIQLLNQLDGRTFIPPQLFSPPAYFARELFFIHGLRSHEDLHQPMQKLLEELSQYLRFQQKISTNIRWRFFRFSKQSHYLRVYFSKPQMQAEEMLVLSQLQLPQLPMDSPVESISLSANQFLAIHDVSESNPAPNDLLDFAGKKSNSELAPPNGDQRLLKDRILARLGNTTLFQIERHSCFLPEQKNAYSQLSHTALKKTNAIKKEDTVVLDRHELPQTRLPTWLLESPIAIQLEKTADNSLQGFINNQACHLHILKGPERLTARWWDKPQQRDYFVVGKVAPQATHYAAIYWLYQDCLKGQWFLQGVFS